MALGDASLAEGHFPGNRRETSVVRGHRGQDQLGPTGIKDGGVTVYGAQPGPCLDLPELVLYRLTVFRSDRSPCGHGFKVRCEFPQAGVARGDGFGAKCNVAGFDPV